MFIHPDGIYDVTDFIFSNILWQTHCKLTSAIEYGVCLGEYGVCLGEYGVCLGESTYISKNSS